MKLSLLDNVKLRYINGKLHINLRSFIKFLKANESYQGIRIKSSNIAREFKSYRQGVISLDGERFVSFFACLRFSFKHASNYAICTDTAEAVEQSVLQNQLNLVGAYDDKVSKRYGSIDLFTQILYINKE